jgi:hypothetical protein
LANFGGFDSADRDGRHYIKFRLLAATVDLMTVGERLYRTQLQNATDAELAVSEEHVVSRLVRERPEMVLAAAKLAGWKLVPPSQEGDSD